MTTIGNLLEAYFGVIIKELLSTSEHNMKSLHIVNLCNVNKPLILFLLLKLNRLDSLTSLPLAPALPSPGQAAVEEVRYYAAGDV